MCIGLIWSHVSVCLSLAPSCALLGRFAVNAQFRCYDNIQVCKLIALYTANVYSAEVEMSASTCLYSLYAWFHLVK